MSAQNPKELSTTWALPVMLAVFAHGLALVLLVVGRVQIPAAAESLPTFRLIPPPEGEGPIYMVSSNPDSMPPPGMDGISDPNIGPEGTLNLPLENTADSVPDAALADILATERESLRAELQQLTELAAAGPAPSSRTPVELASAGGQGSSGPAPEGAVRELDLDGFPQAVIDEVMERYNLKVVTRQIEEGHRGQNFLSSASKGGSERFFGGMKVPAGVYEVFQLSRDSVAHMSRLEEKALRDRGLEPLKSRVVRIVFGIVKTGSDKYDLGVKSLEAEAVVP